MKVLNDIDRASGRLREAVNDDKFDAVQLRLVMEQVADRLDKVYARLSDDWKDLNKLLDQM